MNKLAIIAIALCVSCGSSETKKTPIDVVATPMAINFYQGFEEYRDKAQSATERAYSRLKECQLFNDELSASQNGTAKVLAWPRTLTDLENLKDKVSIEFKDGLACSGSYTDHVVLWINKEAMDDDICDWDQVILHELMHAMGALHNGEQQTKDYDAIVDGCTYGVEK